MASFLIAEDNAPIAEVPADLVCPVEVTPPPRFITVRNEFLDFLHRWCIWWWFAAVSAGSPGCGSCGFGLAYPSAPAPWWRLGTAGLANVVPLCFPDWRSPLGPAVLGAPAVVLSVDAEEELLHHPGSNVVAFLPRAGYAELQWLVRLRVCVPLDKA